MARRRTIHGKISLNRDLADMSPFTCLVFTWGIAHCDDWGVIEGDPVVFKAQVFPLRKESPKRVQEAIDELVAAGMVVRYERDGKTCLHYPGWDAHQEGLHKRTRTRTELPLPVGHPLELTGKDPRRPEKQELPGSEPEIPGSSGKFPPKGSEEKRSEENDDSAAAPALDMRERGLALYCSTKRTTDSDPAAEQEFDNVAAAYGVEATYQAAIVTHAKFASEAKAPVGSAVASYLLKAARSTREAIEASGADAALAAYIAEHGRCPPDPFQSAVWEAELTKFREQHVQPA